MCNTELRKRKSRIIPRIYAFLFAVWQYTIISYDIRNAVKKVRLFMEQRKETNKMGTAPINKLMLTMGIPMIISMVLQAVYNIVDSAFVSNMPTNGEAALNALTLAFPVQVLMIAFGIGTGVGVNALISRSLGAGNTEQANKGAGNGLFLSAVIYAIFLLFGLFGTEIYVKTQTSDTLIAEMANSYLKICCTLSFGIIFFSIYEKMLQSTGKSLFSTIAQIGGAVTNIILDPIMIYGYLGCPELGVKGAAYATVIGQLVSLVLALTFHITLNKEISNSVKYARPSVKIIGEIYSIGLPAIIAQALMSFMTYGLNIILGKADVNAVTAYGLYYKIQQFILFAAFGLRDAVTPIVSYNYGMKNRERVKSGIKCGIGYTLMIMFAGFIVLEATAVPLTGAFGLSSDTGALCVSAIRIISVSFMFAGLNIAYQGIYQALQSGAESLIVSLCRQLIFVLPVAYILAQVVISSPSQDASLVWITFPITEAVTALIATLLMRNIYNKKVRAMNSD